MSHQRAATTARILLAALLFSTPGWAAVGIKKTGGGSPAVQSTQVAGDVVAVTVSNPTPAPQVVVVEVLAVVDGSTVAASQSLSVSASGSATASVDFGSPVSEVVTVGLVDDPNPM